ncbi:hypothetical protein CEE44_02540 [Candidatus Woesearchaeota archaeon B3_Woes]|nr:MAG: hypothetical protein CEE44_02540 [Candidatus Woesearchaeota archaeon B3_Woes]
MKEKFSKKGQLTFFMLIGFVFLIVMGLVFYAGKQTTGHKTRKEALVHQETTFDIASIRSYVTACLGKVAKDGMKLLGNQGGVIYDYQGGIDIPRPANFSLTLVQGDTKLNVSYGLKRSSSESYNCLGGSGITCKNNISEVLVGNFKGGEYPWMGFPKPSERNCTLKKGCFGDMTYLPELDGGGSMYNQLKVYINNTFENCIDLSIFEDEGFKIELNGTLSVSVNTTEETIITIINYPLNIVDPTTKKQIRVDEFYYDTKVRLKKLHEIANTLLDFDKNNESYDVTIDSLGLIDGNMILTILRHGQGGNEISPFEDNIIKIEDNFSNTPFIFQFARQNRYPVLENITSPKTIGVGEVLNETYFSDMVNVTDPDEKSITVYYTSLDLGLARNTSFSKTIISQYCESYPPVGNGIGGSFTVEICVSDNHYSPYSCVPGFDKSRDWQYIDFTITGTGC